MKRILLAALWLFFTVVLMAQKSKSVFLEVAGNGIVASVNFDSRLNKTEKGLGYRLGFGYVPPSYSFFDSDPAEWTVPVGLNYLIGRRRHYLETGLGLTYYFFNGSGTDILGTPQNEKGNGFIFFPSAGYRYAPGGKAFQGRLFVSPAIDSDGAQFYWGFSLGYKF